MCAGDTGRCIVFRCDGDDRIGAGHVARCLPLANAFGKRGHLPWFCGSYGGLAKLLLNRAGLPVCPVAALDEQAWAAAVVDSYSVASSAICELAERMPVGTIAEASRCDSAGVLVDFHLDRAGEASGPRLLPGPKFALVDPGFAAARRDRTGSVETALVAVGGGAAGQEFALRAVRALRATFAEVRILLAGPALAAELALPQVEPLPSTTTVLDVIGDVDVAVSAAGNTAYELAAAGVPAVLRPIVANQDRVARGAGAAGFALVAGEDPAAAIRELADPKRRAELQRAGPATIDGCGADRAAAGLEERWFPPGR